MALSAAPRKNARSLWTVCAGRAHRGKPPLVHRVSKNFLHEEAHAGLLLGRAPRDKSQECCRRECLSDVLIAPILLSDFGLSILKMRSDIDDLDSNFGVTKLELLPPLAMTTAGQTGSTFWQSSCTKDANRRM